MRAGGGGAVFVGPWASAQLTHRCPLHFPPHLPGARPLCHSEASWWPGAAGDGRGASSQFSDLNNGVHGDAVRRHEKYRRSEFQGNTVSSHTETVH